MSVGKLRNVTVGVTAATVDFLGFAPGSSLPSGCPGRPRRFFSCAFCKRPPPSGRCEWRVRDHINQSPHSKTEKGVGQAASGGVVLRPSVKKRYLQHGDHLWLLLHHLGQNASVAAA